MEKPGHLYQGSENILEEGVGRNGRVRRARVHLDKMKQSDSVGLTAAATSTQQTHDPQRCIIGGEGPQRLNLVLMDY